MGTAKRERKKAGHRARLSAERAMQARYERRRRIVLSVGTGFAVLLGIGLLMFLSKGSDSTSTAAVTTTTTASTASTSVDTTPAAESAAGKPCVAFADTLPAGAPTVDVPVGTPPTSLQITDEVVGTGPAVTASSTVTVDYIGVSCSTGTVFDDSYSAGQPATFGLNQVIPGWTQGLQGMQVGGRRLLVIPPDLGYGSTGQGSIAPDETLVFVVDLKSIS